MAGEYKDYRCQSCHKLLLRGWLAEGKIEIKCRHCQTLNTISSSRFNELLCAIAKCPGRVTVEQK